MAVSFATIGFANAARAQGAGVGLMCEGARHDSRILFGLANILPKRGTR
jgi:hypothetical protein